MTLTVYQEPMLPNKGYLRGRKGSTPSLPRRATCCGTRYPMRDQW